MQFLPLGPEEPLEEVMATHSSILAWRMSWTEPGGLQYIELQRTGPEMSQHTANTCVPKITVLVFELLDCIKVYIAQVKKTGCCVNTCLHL